MIKQYKDRYNKIDRKVLRPVSFNSLEELHSFLSSLIFDKKALIYVYCSNGNSSVYPIDKIEIADRRTLFICFSKYRKLMVVANGYYYVKAYTNKEYSMFVYNTMWDNENAVYIIK